MKQSNTDLSIGSEASDLVNAFFSNSIKKENQKQFPFMGEWQYYTFVFFSQGYIKSPALCPNVVSRNLDYTDVTQESC